MRYFATLLLGELVVLSLAQSSNTSLTSVAPSTIGDFSVSDAINAATSAGIDLSLLNGATDGTGDIATAALSYLSVVASNATNSNNTGTTTSRRKLKRANTGNGIDTHAHIVFPWYRQLVPLTGGNPTPNWTVQGHLGLDASLGIVHSVLSNSSPQANVFFGNPALTRAMARLLNICVAGVVAAFPGQFSFFAVVPLPNVDDAIAEAQYALDTLGAVGITVMTNHEGIYLGNSAFQPFWSYLNSRPGKTIVFVHPTNPYVLVNGVLTSADPTQYAPGLVEFYFETARCFMDLTYSSTLMTFTNIQWIAAHTGGAFASIIDRMIKSVPQLEASAKAVYASRVWWDSAGPTYPNQVKGIQAFVPNSQLLLGTDYPYAPGINNSYAGLVNDPNLSAADLTSILSGNAQLLFGSKINCN